MSSPAGDINQIAHRFAYHPPSNEDIGRLHEHVRSQHVELALWVYTHLPHSRERQLALTKIEESMMWANACIARNQSEIVSKDYADKNRSPA